MTGTTINIVAFIGVIMLAGIVVNNAIVLVDLINQLRAAGKDKLEAIYEAGAARLRPILMTSLTTTLGLLPILFGRKPSCHVTVNLRFGAVPNVRWVIEPPELGSKSSQ